MRTLVLAFLWLGLAGLAAGQSAYREIDAANGGTIKGAVRFKGKAPELEKIAVQKDQAICGAFKTSPCLKLGKDNGVANTLVYLEGMTQGKRFPPVGTKAVLDQKNCEYHPHILIVFPTTQLEILNSDPMLHNVHVYGKSQDPGNPLKTLFNMALPLKGQKVAKSIAESGSFLSVCDAGHPWMSAHLVVATHPYYSVTDADGSYSLENVPPGKYTLRMWHEGVVTKQEGMNRSYISAPPMEATSPVVVPAGGAVTVDFTLTLPG